MVTPKMANRRAAKRILKPVIEKKRRDRINQRLDELRTLLLENTLDSRLQNPKLEKAEILELTVEYIRTKATAVRHSLGDSNKDSDPHDATAPTPLSRRPPKPFASVPESISVQKQMPSNPVYKAGFKECVSRLASFIDCVEPSQRDSFVQGLCHHLDSYSCALSQGRVSSQAAHHPWIPNAELTCRTDVPAIGPMRANAEPFSYTNSLYPQSFLLHPTGQAMTHPYLSPPYSVSPPPSPCYSSSSPTYLSVPCHFPFSPTFSPLSSDSSSSSFSLSTPAVSTVPGAHVHGSSPSCQPRTLRRALFHNQTQSVWRPW
ncbi:enhancer of split mbeta protein-like [Carassius carassius]|uniref:enhancer of split mbeta protein-like n=1 Tax=Carassius carassius TaxID=217509 RepID=UPI0028694E8C|nr:enhancer of split mbeta protein-like [Carassius carassius]